MAETASQASTSLSNVISEVNHPVLSQVSAMNFAANEAISTLYCFELKILSPTKLNSKDIIGTEIGVKLSLGSKERWFHGQINVLNAIQQSDTYHSHDQAYYYTLTIVPTLWQADQILNSRVFENMAVEEVINTVLASYPNLSVNGSHANSLLKTTQPMIIQYEESDYNFIARLLYANQSCYYFQHKKSEHQLLIHDFKQSDNLTDAASLGTFSLILPSASSARAQGIHRWQTRESQVPQHIHTRGYQPFPRQGGQLPASPPVTELSEGGLQLKADLPAQNGQEGASIPLVSSPAASYFSRVENSPNSVQTDAEQLNTQIHGNYQAKRVETIAESDLPALMPGCYFKLKDDGVTYFIQSIDHSASNKDKSEAVKGNDAKGLSHYHNCFIAQAENSTTLMSAKTFVEPELIGLHRAKVVDAQGQTSVDAPTLVVDDYGRVRVRFFWDSNGHQTCYLRVAQSWSGGNWGTQFLPRVGDEVLVSFIGGDSACPIIVGSAPNQAKRLPYMPSGQDVAGQPISGIMSRSFDNQVQQEFYFDDQQRNICLQTNQVGSVSGASICMNPAKLQLKVGGSSIIITSDEIVIKSKKVKINQ